MSSRSAAIALLAFALTLAAVAAPIHSAARFGELGEVKAILAKDPKQLEARDDQGRTPLYCAATALGFGEAPAVVAFLLAKGADPNAATLPGGAFGDTLTALGYLTGMPMGDDMRVQRLALVKQLLAAGADVTVRDRYGNTPLHRAVWCHYDINPMLDVIDALLGKADVNIRNAKGETALMQAASSNNMDMTSYLLKKGADINAADDKGRTALHHAMLMHAVWSDGKSVVSKRKPILELLLANGATLEARDKEGNTPLHAAAHGTLEALQTLLDKGADVTATTADGSTALHLATRGMGGTTAEIGAFLIGKGLNPNARNAQGRTPMFYAVQFGLSDDWKPAVNTAIAVLLAKGADLKAVDNDGNTLMHAAVEAPLALSQEGMRFLLHRGADINAKNTAGKTPLDVATKTGDPKLIAWLKERGAKAGA